MLNEVSAGTLTELVYSIELKKNDQAQDFLNRIGELNGNNKVVLISGQQEVDL